jgi:hypothetical protein
MSVQQALEIADTLRIQTESSFKDKLITLQDIQSFVIALPQDIKDRISTQSLQDFKQRDTYLKRNELAYLITQVMNLSTTH